MESNGPGEVTVAIVSDIHYAGAAERARGNDYEMCAIPNPVLRTVARAYRHIYWMRHPFSQAAQLDRFLVQVRPATTLSATGIIPATAALWV